jgi:hypothetical protein
MEIEQEQLEYCENTDDMYNLTNQVCQIKHDIDVINENILNTYVDIKLANRCRHGLCYIDVADLENKLSIYKSELAIKEQQLKELSFMIKRL